jgi:hypothetical protein
MGREPFERVGACQTLARQTAPTALARVYRLTAWSPSRSSLWSFSNRSMSSGVTSAQASGPIQGRARPTGGARRPPGAREEEQRQRSEAVARRAPKGHVGLDG